MSARWWLYSGSRSFEAKFPPASISLKTEGCRVEQVFISRVSHPVPNIVIYIYQNPTNPGVRATKRFTNDMVCLLRKPSKTEARKQPVKVRKWTNLKNILRKTPGNSCLFKNYMYLCSVDKGYQRCGWHIPLGFNTWYYEGKFSFSFQS